MELATPVAESRDAARDVEREANAGERGRQLDDANAAYFHGFRELEADARAADGEGQ
ncbi:MAG TPA: hypothetical protein VHV30_02385 [Polyangiaceae bacterium]|nr:hypothetical protein [Polyangiaceae bacterium]